MNRLTDKRFTGDGYVLFSSPEWKRILSHIPSLKNLARNPIGFRRWVVH